MCLPDTPSRWRRRSSRRPRVQCTAGLLVEAGSLPRGQVHASEQGSAASQYPLRGHAAAHPRSTCPPCGYRSAPRPRRLDDPALRRKCARLHAGARLAHQDSGVQSWSLRRLGVVPEFFWQAHGPSKASGAARPPRLLSREGAHCSNSPLFFLELSRARAAPRPCGAKESKEVKDA